MDKNLLDSDIYHEKCTSINLQTISPTDILSPAFPDI